MSTKSFNSSVLDSSNNVLPSGAPLTACFNSSVLDSDGRNSILVVSGIP